MWYSGRFRHQSIRLVIIAALGWFVFYGPSPMPKPLFRTTIDRTSSSTRVWEDRFRIEHSIPRLYVNTFSNVSGSRLNVDLEGEAGLWLLRDFPINKGHASFSCGGELPPGEYLIRVHEANVVGNYLIEVGSISAVTWWQRLLLVLASSVIVGAVLCLTHLFRRKAGPASPAVQMGRAILLRMSIVLCAIFIYLLLHEGAHALASTCFGSFDWSRADFFGLTGAPHSGIRPDVDLKAWQTAIQSIVGPLLPILVGWVLFVAWRSARGKRIRSNRVVSDYFFSFTVCVQLISSLGLLIPMAGLRRDGDYAGFIGNVPIASWQANTILLLIVVISVAMLVPVSRHLIELRQPRSKQPIPATSPGDRTAATKTEPSAPADADTPRN